MTPLCQRILKDMQIRRLSPTTQRVYVASLAGSTRRWCMQDGYLLYCVYERSRPSPTSWRGGNSIRRRGCSSTELLSSFPMWQTRLCLSLGKR